MSASADRENSPGSNPVVAGVDRPLADKEYGQVLFISLDLAGSEGMAQSLSPQGNRDLLDRYRTIVHDEVIRAGGFVGGWQGDGAMAFLGTAGDEDPLIRRGEAISRTILERICAEVPEIKARLGVDSRPARFYSDVGRIFSEGAIRAARLQAFGRKLARGGILVISPQVYSPLDGAIRALYREAEGPGTQVFAYVPERCGEWLPVSGGEERQVQRQESPVTPTPIITPELWERDTRWPFRGGHELQFVVCAQALQSSDFQLQQHRQWILDNFLRLPIGSRIFRDQDEVRSGELTFFLAESQQAPPIQFCRFYQDGSFAFGDRGWTSLPGWEGAFYPEAVRRPLSEIFRFLHDYYAKTQLHVDIRTTVAIQNVVGCVRKTDPARHLGMAGQFEYDQPLIRSVTTPPADLWPRVATELYHSVLRDSNLDPQLWARPFDDAGRGR